MTLLKVFTLNVWGIPSPIAKDKIIRIDALAEALGSQDYDIVCLQELWNTDDFKFIAKKIQSKMPYKHYFHSGLFGSGLCTYSKWPIIETFYHKFPLNGYVHKISHGDWIAGKGVGLAKIRLNDKIINVFNTHLHAQYCEENDEYLSHRLSQVYEASQLVNLGSESSALTIFVGDFNSKPSDICTKVLRSLPGLQDAFIHFENEHEYGTNETTRNYYTPPEALQKNPLGSRLDYILFKSNSHHEARSVSYGYALPERIPSKDVSYSDHEAIEATIELKEKSSKTQDLPDDNLFHEVLEQSCIICKSGLGQVTGNRRTLAWISLLLFIIVITHVFLSNVFFVTWMIDSLIVTVFVLWITLNIYKIQGLCGYKNFLIGLVLVLIVIAHYVPSLTWIYMVVLPIILVIFVIWAVLYQIEVQSLRGFHNSLKVLRTSISSISR